MRAAQDRRLADGTSLFSKADAWEEAGRMTVELAAAPGRAARKAELSVKFGKVEILRPSRHSAASGLPKTIGVTLVVGREINPPDGEEPALWLLLTTHQVNDVADARRIIGFYRLRWTIEQFLRSRRPPGPGARLPKPRRQNRQQRTRTPRAPSPTPHGSSQGSEDGPATTANPAPSSCSEA